MIVQKVMTSVGEVELKLPDSKSEITLRQSIRLSELKLQEHLLLQELEEFKLRLEVEDVLDDDPNTVYSVVHFTADKAKIVNKLEEVYADILRAILGEEEDYLVDVLPYKTLYALSHKISVESETPAISHFYFPEATKPDIEALEREKHEILSFYSKSNERLKKANKKPIAISLKDNKRIYEIDKQIEVLKIGRFNVLPAERIMFETRIHLDTIKKTLATIPPAVKANLDKSGVSLDQYIKELIHWEELETLKEKKERFKLEAELKKYIREYESGICDRAAKIISHVCVPEGMTYSSSKASARTQHFLNLDMNTVDGILSFFLLLRKISTKDTALSLMKKENPKLRKLRNM